jgi:mannose-6-phosphate isomerase
MDLLGITVQPYAWGSRTAIPELLGIPNPAGTAQAELWMGAHPAAPSPVVRGGAEVPLDAVIAADPVGELGAAVARRFGGRLPFLLKVLAAHSALSIQLHPDRATAEAGFAADNARGLAPDASGRVYVDDWPKPEILCALTRFEVLAGLRAPREAAEVLARLGVADLEPLIADLRAATGSAAAAAAVGATLGRLLSRPREDVPGLVEAVVAACADAAHRDGPFAAAYDAVVRVSADHPGDIGLVCSLLMNHTVVEPGEALFMDAGGVHAYIQGTGVELMAASDNVIRAGLTPKHIDVPELLRVLDPAVPVPVLKAREESPGVEVFDTAVPEFRLRRVTVDGESDVLPGDGEPRILLCVQGGAEVVSSTDRLALRRGRSCFVSAADRDVRVVGSGTLFLASPGE